MNSTTVYICDVIGFCGDGERLFPRVREGQGPISARRCLNTVQKLTKWNVGPCVGLCWIVLGYYRASKHLFVILGEVTFSTLKSGPGKQHDTVLFPVEYMRHIYGPPNASDDSFVQNRPSIYSDPPPLGVVTVLLASHQTLSSCLMRSYSSCGEPSALSARFNCRCLTWCFRLRLVPRSLRVSSTRIECASVICVSYWRP